MARDPRSAVERVRGRLDRRQDARDFKDLGLTVDELYPIDAEWLHSLHEALGVAWPCECVADASALYEEIMAGFAAQGLPERYHGWCDGGRAFTRAAWCLTIHLQPHVVVETGVARGVTSRFVLEAMERSGAGTLSSVDLPAVDSRFHSQNAIAVPEHLRHRWTYVLGTSRRRLPTVLAQLGEIDLFIHDSLHTGPNTRFEIDHAWDVLRPGGAMLVDDVYDNLAFHQLVERVQPRWWGIGANDDGGYRFGILLKHGDLDEALRSSARSTADAGRN
jgi:hypothetical protein